MNCSARSAVVGAILVAMNGFVIRAGDLVGPVDAPAQESAPASGGSGSVDSPKVFTGVWYRTPQEGGAMVPYLASGDLSISGEAIAFTSKKLNLRIPASSVRRVLMSRLKGSGMLEWIVVEYDEGAGPRAAAFRDAGMGRQTNEIAAALSSASPMAGGGSGAARAPQASVAFEFDGRSWELGYQTEVGSQAISEYVLHGETVDRWTELVTLQTFSGPEGAVPSSSVVDEFKQKVLKGCPDALWRVVNEGQDDVVYEWRTTDCRGWDNQHEIARIFKGGSGLHRLAYATRTLPLADEKRAQWVSLIGAAHVKAVVEPPAAALPPPPTEVTAETEFVPYEGMKDQFILALPKGWYVHDQNATFGQPGPFGVVVFSPVQLGHMTISGDPNADEIQKMMGRVDSGEIPSFFVDRYRAEKGRACESFTEKGRKHALEIYTSPGALGKGTKLVGTPEVQAVPVGGCQGLRVMMRTMNANGAEWDFLIYAASDAQTSYDFVLRNEKTYFEKNLPMFEKAVSGLRLAAAR